MGESERLAAAVAASPADAQLRRALAARLAGENEPRAALDQYRAVLALIPNDPDAAADAGLMARRCGLETEILPIVREAAEVNPGHARLWQVLGLMHRALDDLGPAIAALDRAAKLAPGDGLIAHGAARVRFEGGLPAAAHFERALRLAPASEDVLNGLLAALAAEGRTAEATALGRAALRKHPEWIATHVTLARHLWSIGEEQGFATQMEEALHLAPGNVPLWKEFLLTQQQAGRYEAVLAAVERGRAAAGPNPVFDVNEAICHAKLGNVEAADRLFVSLSRFGDPMLAVRHVQHLLQTGRPDAAERIALPFTRTPSANFLWPYVSIIWRLTSNPEWDWLEGDTRLVGVYDLGAAIPSLDTLAETLRGLHVTTNQPLEQTVRGGTQTDGVLFQRTEPEIRALRAAVVDAVETHIAQLPPPDPRHPVLARRAGPVRFSGSWSIRLGGGGRHINHIHPLGWLSSALYVALPDESARGPAPAGWLALGEPFEELGLDLPSFRMVEPKPGRLALFPSIMWHGTRPFDDGERLTVAFDVAPPA